jgi:hypothetical protein
MHAIRLARRKHRSPPRRRKTVPPSPTGAHAHHEGSSGRATRDADCFANRPSVQSSAHDRRLRTRRGRSGAPPRAARGEARRWRAVHRLSLQSTLRNKKAAVGRKRPRRAAAAAGSARARPGDARGVGGRRSAPLYAARQVVGVSGGQSVVHFAGAKTGLLELMSSAGGAWTAAITRGASAACARWPRTALPRPPHRAAAVRLWRSSPPASASTLN